MGYHIEDAIQDKVIPAMNKFLESGHTQEDLAQFIRDINDSDPASIGKVPRLIVATLVEDEGRLGKQIQHLFHTITDYEMDLKELVYTNQMDRIVEKFGVEVDE
jgi:hypothetical protein